jgi:hypothetical protein
MEGIPRDSDPLSPSQEMDDYSLGMDPTAQLRFPSCSDLREGWTELDFLEGGRTPSTLEFFWQWEGGWPIVLCPCFFGHFLELTRGLGTRFGGWAKE